MLNISYYWNSKKAVVQFVENIRASLKPGSVLITITTPKPLGGCSVVFVTEEWLEGTEPVTEARGYFSQRSTISREIIPAFLFQKENQKR